MARNAELFRTAEAALWASLGLDPMERWVQLPGGEGVRIQIVGDGPPILFIHGGSSSGANWAPLVAAIEGFRCVVVDRPGCGLSDPVAGGARLKDIIEVEHFADRFVADVLDGLRIDQAHLLSTSLGGYFAMRGAAAHPERVASIVELAWPMGAPIGHVPMSMRVAATPGLGAVLTKAPPTRFAVKLIMKQLGLGRALENGRVSDELINWFLALLRYTDTMANELRASPKIITPIGGINTGMVLSAQLLAQIAAPTLLIWGGEDPMGGEEVARRFAAMIDNATVEMLPLAGHAPWIDDPQRCASLVGEFLAT